MEAICQSNVQPINQDTSSVIKVQELEKQLESAKTSIDDLLSGNLGFENKIDQIEGDIEKAQTNKTATSPSDEQIKALEASVFELTRVPRQVELLKDRLRTLEVVPSPPKALSQKLRAFKSDIDNLRDGLSNCENAITEFRQKFYKSSDDIDELRNTVKESSNTLQDLKAQVNKVKDHQSDDYVSLKTIKRDLEDVTNAVDKESEDLRDISRRIEKCASDISAFSIFSNNDITNLGTNNPELPFPFSSSPLLGDLPDPLSMPNTNDYNTTPAYQNWDNANFDHNWGDAGLEACFFDRPAQHDEGMDDAVLDPAYPPVMDGGFDEQLLAEFERADDDVGSDVDAEGGTDDEIVAVSGRRSVGDDVLGLVGVDHEF